MDELCVTHTLSLFEWIAMASTLGVEGLEMYPGFFTSLDQAYLRDVREALQRYNLLMPLLCASPDFTQPDPAARRAAVENHKRMIDLVAFFDAPPPRTCRVLSGQRRPEVSEDDGVAMVVECVEALLSHAAERRVILALENHYKDNYWTHPEFAQHLRLFRRIVEAIDSPWFGVNYDPSNAILAGEDPLEVLDAVKHRVVSMHASDRGLLPALWPRNRSLVARFSRPLAPWPSSPWPRPASPPAPAVPASPWLITGRKRLTNQARRATM